VANLDVYGFFWRARGPGFTVRAVPLHWLYYGYSMLAFGLGFGQSWIALLREGQGVRPRSGS